MNCFRKKVGGVLSAAIVLSLSGWQPVISSDFEAPIMLLPADLLPAELLDNPSYQVHDEVRNDGFMNRYQVESQFGRWEISSTTLFRIRLAEIDAMVKMGQIEEEQSTDDAVKDDVDEIKEGLGNIVEDPEEVLKGTVSGVRKLFTLSGEAWRSRHTREDENELANIGKAASGYNKAWREYAGQFGVDPYSSNTALNEELDRLASAAAKGSVFAMTVKALIPGGLGLAISATSLSKSLNELLVTSSEVELRIVNRDKLQAMGVDAELIERFLDDSRSSPTIKTYLVGALDAMEGVKGRERFLAYAINPPSEEIAMYRSLSALMYASYHQDVQKLDRFIGSGSVAVAVDGANQLVIQAPLDHLLWTEPLDAVIGMLEETVVPEIKPDNKLIWLNGTASPRVIEELKNRGWTTRQQTSFEG